jgi:hypothetical protein
MASRPTPPTLPTSGTRCPNGVASSSSPEIGFLLECARSPAHASPAIPASELDWDEVLHLAAPHGMEPLIFRRLSSTGHDHVPHEVWRRIEALQQENVKRTLAAMGELASILRMLADEGIEAISYKGPILALQLYGDVAARRFGDLDLMVRPSQLRAAREVFARSGYVTDLALPAWQFEQYVKTQKEIAFIHERTHQEVDLQWVVTERTFGLRWDMGGIWDRSVRFDIAGSSVRTFAPNDLALILSVHGTTHLWERLAWIADMGALVEKGEVEWAKVLGEARRMGSERILLASLALSDRVTSCDLPGPVSRAMDDRARRLAESLQDRALSADTSQLAKAERPFHPMHARLRDRPLDQMRYATSLAVTPTVRDWEWVPLPGRFRPLYYLIRPLRLAVRYARGSHGANP